MNALDLPPRRPLPRETRDRIRRSVDTGIAGPGRRSRAPLAAAAAVAVLALGAVVVARWAPGPSPEHPAATPPPTPAPNSAPTLAPSPAPPVTMALPGTRTYEDLDHCADVVVASPRTSEFAPRAEWRPVFTATAPDGARITAFSAEDGTPAFCEVTATTATVSDPTAEWGPVAVTPEHLSPASVHGVYLSPTGLLAGVAAGADALEFSIVRPAGRRMAILPVGTPAVRDGLFVVNLGECGADDHVNVVGRDREGMAVVRGMVSCIAFPPAGATGPLR